MKSKQNNKKERKTFTYEEAKKITYEYFGGDELATKAWLNKYALKDQQGNIYEDTPDMMHDRIASEIYRIEQKYENPLSYEKIRESIDKFSKIVPQGSPMAGIGNPYQVTSLSNCYVIGNEYDSYGAILKTDQEQVQLMKRRAGVGHDLSHIRPTGTSVNNSALSSTGVVPFMERYSNSTEEVAQDGRRGALMETISIEHPDSEGFIDAKMEKDKVTGANVSVKISDNFMDSVVNGKNFEHKFPVGSQDPEVSIEKDANELWNKIINNAWESAEPGVVFWDTIKRETIVDEYSSNGFETSSLNPCGEITLSKYDSCRLVAMNLYGFVENPFTKSAYFNWDKFKEYSSIIARFMDDIIDLEIEKIDGIIEKIKNDPEPHDIKNTEIELWEKIKRACIDGRRAGLGVTGEGDMLAALGYIYGTQESIDFVEEVHKNYTIEVFRESANLAKERGPFPIYDGEKEKGNPFLERVLSQDKDVRYKVENWGRRFIGNMTIAPTGTVSLMTQTTSGVECAFMISYERKRKINPNDKNARSDYIDSQGVHWEKYHVFHHKFEEWLRVNGYDVQNVKNLPKDEVQEIIKKSPYYGATSNDVDWVKKVKMQGAIQKWIDHSISVTVNLPKNISKEKVNEVYLTAWRWGCKGCTIYRDGSRDGVLTSGEEKNQYSFSENNAPKRPKSLKADVMRFQNNYEKWIGFVGVYNNRPYEIFTGNLDNFPVPNSIDKGWLVKNKTSDGSKYNFVYYDKNGEKQVVEWINKAFNPEFWNYAKIISGILRHGMPLPYVVDLIQTLTLGGESINTWKNGIERMIKKYISDGSFAPGSKCNNCGSKKLMYKEGCLSCANCGSSKC